MSEEQYISFEAAKLAKEKGFDEEFENMHVWNNFKGEILEDVEMARQEEREKAIKALDIAIMAIFERNTHSVSMGELRAQFNKLLNE